MGATLTCQPQPLWGRHSKTGNERPGDRQTELSKEAHLEKETGGGWFEFFPFCRE